MQAAGIRYIRLNMIGSSGSLRLSKKRQQIDQGEVAPSFQLADAAPGRFVGNVKNNDPSLTEPIAGIV